MIPFQTFVQATALVGASVLFTAQAVARSVEGAVPDIGPLSWPVLAKESAVGIFLLMMGALFLRDRQQDRKAQAEEREERERREQERERREQERERREQEREKQREQERHEHDKKRDAAMKEIADEFRKDVRSIVNRFEGNQSQLVSLTREAVTAIASHDNTIKAIVEEQAQLKMVILTFKATGTVPVLQSPHHDEDR